ncbi:MAG: lipoprotein-releasing system transmembrane subunit LolC, partial [Candidatus Omnitrophica bacterium]|nr:lipoprotein-releasing system transmembrane subunit LolC [Candidatus Omnitrophota bacterium]
LAICFALERYPIIRLPADIYYIDRLPVEVGWGDISWILAGALALTLVSTFYPAVKASKLDPVAALRYE